MPAPAIESFGDATHDPGDTNIDIGVTGAGEFTGIARVYQFSTQGGLEDNLTVNSWSDFTVNVDLPVSMNNADATVYLFLQHADTAWSNGFPFVLGTPAVVESGLIVHRVFLNNVGRMMGQG